MEALRKWWMFLVKGIVLIILAFFVFRHPIGALMGLSLYIGIALLMTGLVIIVSTLQLRKVLENWGWHLAEGVVDAIFGFILLTNPQITATILPFLVGFWILIYGIILFANSFGVKKAGIPGWGFQMVTGILTAILGAAITFNPLAGVLAISTFMGIPLLIFGAFNIFLAFNLREIKRETIG